jgi:hypothetical protein
MCGKGIFQIEESNCDHGYIRIARIPGRKPCFQIVLPGIKKAAQSSSPLFRKGEIIAL